MGPGKQVRILTCFDSRMVQLRAEDMAAMVRFFLSFQFPRGTIKSKQWMCEVLKVFLFQFPTVQLREELLGYKKIDTTSFNSCIVQLRVDRFAIILANLFSFNSPHGTIKSALRGEKHKWVR